MSPKKEHEVGEENVKVGKSPHPFQDHTDPHHRFTADVRYLVRHNLNSYMKDSYSEIYVHEVSQSGKALISFMGSKDKEWVDPADFVMVDYLGFGKRGFFG